VRFFAGPGLAALFDAPWMPIYVAAIFAFDSALGLLALGFVAAAGASAWRWRRMATTRPPLLQATLAELRRDEQGLGRGAAA